MTPQPLPSQADQDQTSSDHKPSYLSLSHTFLEHLDGMPITEKVVGQGGDGIVVEQGQELDGEGNSSLNHIIQSLGVLVSIYLDSSRKPNYPSWVNDRTGNCDSNTTPARLCTPPSLLCLRGVVVLCRTITASSSRFLVFTLSTHLSSCITHPSYSRYS